MLRVASRNTPLMIRSAACGCSQPPAGRGTISVPMTIAAVAASRPPSAAASSRPMAGTTMALLRHVTGTAFRRQAVLRSAGARAGVPDPNLSLDWLFA